jgi:hypothetical protein
MPQVEPSKTRIIAASGLAYVCGNSGARRRIEASDAWCVSQGCLPKTSIFGPPGTPI